MTSSRLWRPTTPPLSTDKVVAAAVELLDVSGLESLSMRRLGEQLGAPATTLYSYVGNKDELLDLVLDAVIGTISLPPASDVWQNDVRAAADGFLRVLRAHPWAAALFGSLPAVGPKAVVGAEFLLAALTRAGFAGPALDHAFWVVVNYVAGFAAKEVTWPMRGDAINDMREYVQGKPYPVLADHLRVMTEGRPDDRYSFGLACVVAGLESLVSAARM